MKMDLRLIPPSVAISAALLLGAAPGFALAEAGDEPVKHAVGPSPGKIRDYWTPRRLESARPLALPTVVGGSSGQLTPATRSGRPGGAAPAQASVATASRYAAGETGGETTYPTRVHGKLYFSYPPDNFVCSATVVTSPARDLIVTAGHCLYDADGAGWATNVLFVPGYRDGARPYGSWPATALAATPQWIASISDPEPDNRYDIAAAKLAPNDDGTRIQDVVGARGISWNAPRGLFYRAFGYPAQAPFNGQRNRFCEDRAFNDNIGVTSPPRTQGIGCDMNGGASGGGWIRVGDGTLNGLNSYRWMTLNPFDPPPDAIYSPYFGNAAEDLYRVITPQVRCSGWLVTHLGTPGNDRLIGTPGPDVISGGKGDDRIEGRGGDDVICAGPGDDAVFGNKGADRILAKAGNDALAGGYGSDRLFGQFGRDSVAGGGGRDDLCHGGPGRDRRSAPGCERRRLIP